MASDEQLQKAWRLIRDREIEAGTARGRRVLADPDFAAQWRERMLTKLRAVAQGPWPPGKPPDLTLRGIARWQARQRQREAELSLIALADKGRVRRKASRDARAQSGREREAAAAFQNETLLAELHAKAPRLRVAPAPPQKQIDPAFIPCPHGMEKSSCAYCTARHPGRR